MSKLKLEIEAFVACNEIEHILKKLTHQQIRWILTVEIYNRFCQNCYEEISECGCMGHE